MIKPELNQRYRWRILSTILLIVFVGQYVLVTVSRTVEPKSVDYFKTHQEEIDLTLEQYHQKPTDSFADTPEAGNCRAAEIARQDLLFTHQDPREGRSYPFNFGVPEVGPKPAHDTGEGR